MESEDSTSEQRSAENANLLSGSASHETPSTSAVTGAGTGENVSNLTPMESAIEQEVFTWEMGTGLLVLADKKREVTCLTE